MQRTAVEDSQSGRGVPEDMAMSGGPYNGYSWNQRMKILTEYKRRKAQDGFRFEGQPCDMCGNPDIEPDSWHSEDYSEPFIFTPPATYVVCKTCHLRLHKRFNEPDEWRLYLAHLRLGGYGSEFTKHHSLAQRRQWISEMQAGKTITLSMIRERHVGEYPWWEELSLDPASLTAAWARPRPLRPRPTRDEYAQALDAIGLKEVELSLLRAHARSPHHSATLRELAAAIPNKQIGEVTAIYTALAQKLCEATGWKPDQPKGAEPIWLGVLAEGWHPENKGAEERWAMIRDLAYEVSSLPAASSRSDSRNSRSSRKEVEAAVPGKQPFEKEFDPKLFEWEPSDAEDIPEEEVFADLAAIGTEPESLKDMEARKRYIAYLAKQQG